MQYPPQIKPTPSIVTHMATQSRLPRWVLVMFVLTYVLAGYLGRTPWRLADVMAYATMHGLMTGVSDWLHPSLFGQQPSDLAYLPYWLGAAVGSLGSQTAPVDSLLSTAFWVRVPFILMMGGTLYATWLAIYHLAKRPEAQPVAFAFGGEANPHDYATSIADAGLLAMMACMGLAQLSHETTSMTVQLFSVSLLFAGYAIYALHPLRAMVLVTGALLTLSISGGIWQCLLLGMGVACFYVWRHRSGLKHLIVPLEQNVAQEMAFEGLHHNTLWVNKAGARLALISAACVLLCVLLAMGLNLWFWPFDWPELTASVWGRIGRLLVWFIWPVWLMACWTLWHWRKQLTELHIFLPSFFAASALLICIFTDANDRMLILGLPGFAALAAFALPTFKRWLSAFIDWFTLLFFSACILTIWVMWLSMQTGWPAKPAANVAKLVPGFTASFGWFAFVVACLATVFWVYLVRWRVRQYPSAIWKSMVIPAAGVSLCWTLLMTLWLPVLDHARGYQAWLTGIVQPLSRLPQFTDAGTVLHKDRCLHVSNLSIGHMAALQSMAGIRVQPVDVSTFGRTKPDNLTLATDIDNTVAPPNPSQCRVWLRNGYFPSRAALEAAQNAATTKTTRPSSANNPAIDQAQWELFTRISRPGFEPHEIEVLVARTTANP